MAAAVTGLLHGNTITLDSSVPPLEGKRVHVLIEPLDEDMTLWAEENAALWQEWAERGPQGPISDEDAKTP